MRIRENINTKNYTNLEKLFLIILFSYFFINLFSYNNFLNNYDDANVEYKNVLTLFRAIKTISMN